MTRTRKLGAVAISLVAVVSLLGIAAVFATDLSIRYMADDSVMLMSSTGRDVELPLASPNSAGLMSSSHVRDLDELKRTERQDPPDDVVVSGQWIVGESLTLKTLFGEFIVITIEPPTPYTIYWGRFDAAMSQNSAAEFAEALVAGGTDVQSATTTSLTSGARRVSLPGFTASDNGYSVCAYPTALGGVPTSFTGQGYGGPCGTVVNISVDVGTTNIDGAEYRIWRTQSELTVNWFAIAFMLTFDPGQ